MRRSKQYSKILIRLLVIAIATVGIFLAPESSTHVFADTEVMDNPFNYPGEDSIEIGIRGRYKAGQENALARINEIRKEACKNGYPDPRDRSRKLTMADYKPMEWSTDIEAFARIRAAEASVYPSHRRPGDNEPNESCEYERIGGSENLAWGCSTALGAVNLWYSEKSRWVNGSSGETGHFTSMINPDNEFCGIGAFAAYGIYGCDWGGSICGRFSSAYSFEDTSQVDHTMLPAKKDVIQLFSIRSEYLEDPMFVNLNLYPVPKPTSVTVYEGDPLALGMTVRAVFDKQEEAFLIAPGTYTFSSSNEKILRSDGAGFFTALKPGKCTVTATGEDGSTYTLKAQVKPLLTKPKIKKAARKGTQITVSVRTGWQNAWEATGYQIQIARNKAFTKELKKATVKQKYDKYGNPKNTLSRTIKKLKKKGRYYIRVRAYKATTIGRIYSKWSKVTVVK